jgi:hypothetical protein
MGCGVEATSGDDDGCFGFPEDLVYRYAVIPRDGETLLIWARTLADHPDDDFFSHFDEMLGGLHFTG